MISEALKCNSTLTVLWMGCGEETINEHRFNENMNHEQQIVSVKGLKKNWVSSFPLFLFASFILIIAFVIEMETCFSQITKDSVLSSRRSFSLKLFFYSFLASLLFEKNVMTDPFCGFCKC